MALQIHLATARKEIWNEINNLFCCSFLAANVHYKDSEGQSIMHVVAREWHTDAAMFFRCHGAAIDSPDRFGRTPLFVAAAMNHKPMVEWLLDHGGKY